MPLTLGAAKQSRIHIAAGVDPESTEFLSYLNEATRRLLERGNFWATVVKFRVCTYDGCVTWPRFVATPLAINTRNGSGPVNGFWFDFLIFDNIDRINQARGFFPSSVGTYNDSLTPVVRNIPCGTPRFVRVYPRHQLDVNKQVIVYGTNESGQEIFGVNPPITAGTVLTLKFPYAETSFKLRHVSRISKPVTSLPIDVFQYDDATGLQYPMAYYEPDETEPMYRHSQIDGATGDICCANPLDVLAKISFVPVSYDQQLLQIDNASALKLMVMSIKKEEGGDINGGDAMSAAAVKVLNRELRNMLPDDQIPVNFKPFGSADLRRQRVGTLI